MHCLSSNQWMEDLIDQFQDWHAILIDIFDNKVSPV